MVEAPKVCFDGDDVWVNNNLISQCGGDDEWWFFGDDDFEKEFETLEAAVAFSLEQGNE